MKSRIEKGQKTGWPSKVLIWTDGASRGNPGPASAGLAVYQERDLKNCLYELAFFLQTQTNNFAEYSAVLEALKMSAQNRVRQVILKSDSELLVKQLLGQYKVKSLSLKKLYQECKKWEKDIPQVEFQHIPREQNKKADTLCNFILNEILASLKGT